MRKEITEFLEQEKIMDELITQISECNNRADVIQRVITVVPCILHAENRVGLKIPTIILIEGLSNFQGGNLMNLLILKE